MKLIASVSSLVLLCLLNALPSWASSQASSDRAQTVKVAGFFDDIIDTVDTIDSVNDAIENIDSVNDVINIIDNAIDTIEQQEEQKRAQQEQQERLAAERQYFESLSPEQQEAYRTQLRARQQVQAAAAAGLFWMLMSTQGDSSQENSIYNAGDCYKHDPYGFYVEC